MTSDAFTATFGARRGVPRAERALDLTDGIRALLWAPGEPPVPGLPASACDGEAPWVLLSLCDGDQPFCAKSLGACCRLLDVADQCVTVADNVRIGRRRTLWLSPPKTAALRRWAAAHARELLPAGEERLALGRFLDRYR